MDIRIKRGLVLAGVAALAACSIVPVTPIQPGASAHLQPNEGIAAVVMDTLDPVSQIHLIPIDGNGKGLNLPSMPAGKSLALFQVPAGTYCLQEFQFGRWHFFARSGVRLGCFQVPEGRIAYSGNLQPRAGDDDNAYVRQEYSPRQFLATLQSQYPSLAAAYPTAGPDPVADDEKDLNDIDQEMASWVTTTDGGKTQLIYFRNNTNWPLKLSEFNFENCVNIKPSCAPAKPDLLVAPRTTVMYLKVEPADPKRYYNFQFHYRYEYVR
ncbi:MAG TPA: hypothetical protein VHP13_02355 [Gammaproteobacteria bacterium]|jgi:hypothetical protein|nr:hypothetical protein [Gammaproteobacteria bacterium]